MKKVFGVVFGAVLGYAAACAVVASAAALGLKAYSVIKDKLDKMPKKAEVVQ